MGATSGLADCVKILTDNGIKYPPPWESQEP